MSIGQWVLVEAVVVKQRDTMGNVSIWRCPCSNFTAQLVGERRIFYGKVVKDTRNNRRRLRVLGSVLVHLVRNGYQGKEYQVIGSDLAFYNKTVPWKLPLRGTRVEYIGPAELIVE